jgi:DNA-binding transcriptional MocR family regulator
MTPAPLPTQNARDTSPRYAEIARRYAKAIEDGTYTAGDRLPSIRLIRKDERVSSSTVIQALAQLETLGVIEARPRSGFFVRARTVAPLPSPARPLPGATAVTVSDLVQEIYRAARDPRLVPLASATPSAALLPARALGRAMSTVARRARTGGVEYEMPPGSLELRRMIARRAVLQGCALSADDIAVTSGATEAVHLALLAVASAGDTIAVETPTYYGMLQAIESLGLRVLEVPSLPGTGLDVSALERRLEENRVAAVLAVPNFSNPLGGLVPDAEKARLVRLLAARAIPLIEDDVYGDLAFGDVRPKPVKAWDRDGLVILCGSFSKSLAPGFRVGFVAAGRFRDRVERLKFATNVATPTLPQRAIAHFLRSGSYDRHLRMLRSRLEDNVNRTAAAVAESFPEGTCVSRPRGGCYLWLELPPAVDALELHAAALRAGVAIAPGQIFSPKRAHRNCIRLNCGEPWSERIASAVATVGSLARRLAHRGVTGSRELPDRERAHPRATLAGDGAPD